MIRPEFFKFVEEWAEESADQHITIYEKRYFRKTKAQIEEDVYINHDTSGEEQFIKDEFGEATQEEVDFYIEEFNKEIVKQLGH